MLLRTKQQKCPSSTLSSQSTKGISLKQSTQQAENIEQEEYITLDNWASPGVKGKPFLCKTCSYAPIGTGFCEDFYPENPKILIIMEYPGKEDVVNNQPLSGKMGKFIAYKLFSPLNISRNDLVICNVIRCHPPDGIYPTGTYKNKAELACRQHDNQIKKFDPEVFVITFDLKTILKESAFLDLAQRDISRALDFSNMGYKTAVLMGEKAISLKFQVPFNPGKGGLKSWRGHYFFSKW